ncbi:S-acyl fatty acid synthase thioesterase, medium chain-like [Saccoglossus kowalevskii]
MAGCDLSQLIYRHVKHGATYRIFCFPWAGGGSRYYANWGKLLPDSIEDCFIFFHSMGSHIAFEIARYIKEHHNLEPIHLIVSGTSAPHSELRKKGKQFLSSLPDDEFLEKIKLMGGTPKEVANNKDLMKLFLPVLKADFKLIENYENFLKIVGTTLDPLLSWSELSQGGFSSHMLPGGHFYILEKQNEIKLVDYVTKLFQVEDTADIV